MNVFCFQCKRLHEELGTIPFRAECVSCGSDLHVCKTCRFYSQGKPNDCLIPGTEFIRDRGAANFCEEYAPSDMSTHSPPHSSTYEKAKRLFGEEPPKKRNPLFDEESP